MLINLTPTRLDLTDMVWYGILVYLFFSFLSALIIKGLGNHLFKQYNQKQITHLFKHQNYYITYLNIMINKYTKNRDEMADPYIIEEKKEKKK